METILRLLEEEEKDGLYYLSHIFGWIYFFAWSISFYGQVIENYRRHSVSGLNFDFEIYNLVGFTTYTIYNIRGYISDNLGTGTVEIQDIFFACHALLLTLVTISQILYYFDPKDKLQNISHVTITIILVMIWGAILLVIVESGLEYYDPHVKNDRKYIFNSLVYMGWCKVFISLIKYIPQVISNYKRKSTIGWNIHNILLDFTGGSFSFGQNIIDSFRDEFSVTSDGQPKALNIAKFALSFISIFFDIIFMTQHYILYRDSNSDLGDKKNNKEKANDEEDIADKLLDSNRESEIKE
jgi:cystinosin